MKKFLNNFYFYKSTREKYHLLKYKYNSALWKYINHEYIKGITLLNKSSYPFKDITINIKNKKISDALNIVRNFKQEQYIVEIPSKSFIEPEFGWIITGPNYLLINSLPYCTDESAPNFDQSGLLINSNVRRDVLPQFNNYLKTKLFSQRKIIKAKTVISLRDIGEASYFHFYDDILNKIVLLDDFIKDKEIPFVISKKLYEKKFFKDVLDRSTLKNRNFLVQDDRFIEAENVIYCKPFTLNRILYVKLLDLLDIPKPDYKSKKRIFLTRSKASGRYLENFEEIQEICDDYNFKIIDTENISLDRQIQIFNKTRSIIGLHGAGLVNIIFRGGANLSLLEIFPPNIISYHYYYLSKILGYNYDAIIASDRNNRNISTYYKEPFLLNPQELKEKIIELKNSGFFI